MKRAPLSRSRRSTSVHSGTASVNGVHHSTKRPPVRLGRTIPPSPLDRPAYVGWLAAAACAPFHWAAGPACCPNPPESARIAGIQRGPSRSSQRSLSASLLRFSDFRRRPAACFASRGSPVRSRSAPSREALCPGGFLRCLAWQRAERGTPFRQLATHCCPIQGAQQGAEPAPRQRSALDV